MKNKPKITKVHCPKCMGYAYPYVKWQIPPAKAYLKCSSCGEEYYTLTPDEYQNPHEKSRI